MRKSLLAITLALVGLALLFTWTVAAQVPSPSAAEPPGTLAPSPNPAGPASGNTDILLLPASQTIGVGGMVTVTIQVSSGTQLVDGVGAYIDFDPAIFTLVDAAGDPATMIDNPNTPLTTELENSVDNTLGQINFSAGKLSGTRPSGTFTIGTFRLKARALATGSAVAFSHDLAGNRNSDVAYQGTSVFRANYNAAYTVAAPPTGVVISGPASGLIGNSYTFTATTSPATATAPFNYNWEISYITPPNPTISHTSSSLTDSASFTWFARGPKTVTVTVSNGVGSVVGTKAFQVYEPVVANFDATPRSGQIPLAVNFSNTSTGDYNAASWSFGDGTTSSEINPTHVYTRVGTFNVSMTASGLGGSDNETKSGFITTTGNTDLVLVPGSATVAAGVPFTVAIQVRSGSQQVDGVGAYVNFNPQVLEVVDAAGNPAVEIENAIGNPLTTALENSVDNAAGQISYSVGKLSGAKPSGTFDVGVIRFKPITTTQQTTNVTFAFDAGANRTTDVVNSGATVLRGATGGSYEVVNVILRVALSLQGRSGMAPPNDAYSIPVRMLIYPSGSTSPVYSGEIASDRYGVFTATGLANVSAGNAYTIKLKNRHTLTTTKTVNVVPGLNSIPFCDLQEGDSDDNGKVNITDFSILASTYGKSRGQTGWDSRADFNEQGQVNITDFSLLASNYGKFQENVCAPQAPQTAVHGLNSLAQSSGVAAPLAPTGLVNLDLQPGSATVKPGDIFEVTIRLVAGTQQVDGVGAYLDFDPAVLQVVDASGNPYEFVDPATGNLLTTELENAVDNTLGRVNYSVGKLSGAKPSGTFNIGLLRFKALALAPSGATVSFVFDAANNRLTDVNLSGTSFMGTATGGSYAVVQAPTGVVISGPASGLRGSDLSFTATTSPVTASQPLTYTWQASGQSTVTTSGGISNTTTFNWPSTGTQYVTVTVSNGAGSATSSATAVLFEPVVANFTAAPLTGIAPFTVAFTNTSTGTYDTLAWDFGDGGSSALANPTHEYATKGTYTVTLTASGLGGTDGETKASYVTVYEPAVANFTGAPLSGIAAHAVTFTNTSTGDWSTALWDFGDGATSTDVSPSHTYAAKGTYTVTLTVSGNGGTDSETRASYVTVYAAAVASFTGLELTGVAPHAVTFVNSSSGDWSTALWSFGDGNTSTDANPSHTYAAKGVYSVTLTVSGNGGTSTLTRASYVTVYAPAVADFSASPVSGIAPHVVTFTNQSTGDWVSALWDFGDSSGSSAVVNPVHTYATPGLYTVTLRATGQGGDTNTITKTNYITVYAPVVANFSGTPVSGEIPLAVSFSNLSSGDHNVASWSFGDGSTSTEINPTHVYTKVGVFSVSLTASGPGGTSTLSRTGYVTTTGNTDIVLVPSSGTVASGLPFTVAIQLRSGSQLVDGAAAYLTFDPGVLQVVDASGNPAVEIENAPGNPLTTALENTADNTLGLINYSVGKLSGAKPSGTFDIGVIRFKPITTTQTTTAVFFNFEVGENRVTDVTYAGGTVLRNTTDGLYDVVNVILVGALTLQRGGIAPPATAYSIPVSLKIYPQGSSTPVYSDSLATDLYGTFTVTGLSSVTPGNSYTLTVKNKHALAASKVVAVAPGTNNVTFCTLYEGDANDSNQVNITDFSILAATYGKSKGQTGYDARADFNETNQVNISDFSLLAASYGRSGANVCAPAAPERRVHGLNSVVDFAGLTAPVATSNVRAPKAPNALVHMELTPNAATMARGDIFATTIHVVADTQQVDGVGAYINFNAQVLQVVDAAGNPQAFVDNATGNPLTTELENVVDNSTGQINYSVGKLSGAKPSGTFDIGVIRFKALAPANESMIDFAFDSNNNRFTDVTLSGVSYLGTTAGASVQVVQPPLSVTITGPEVGVAGVKSFTATVSPITTSQPITYVWEATGVAPVTRSNGLNDTIDLTLGNGTSTITVTAFVTLGAPVYDTHTVTLSPAAVADFVGAPVSGIAPHAVTFTNLSTDWSSAVWNFGDGVTSTLTSPSHTYNAKGTYTVTLTVTGDNGSSSTKTRAAYITVYAPAVADFIGAPVSGIAPLTVYFINQSTGDWSTALWDFGDGITSTLANPSHAYEAKGVYTVTLTVTGGGGADTKTRQAYVTVLAPSGANFTASPVSGVAPLGVTFTNLSTGDFDSSLWDFGDGVTSTVASPSHTYNAKGVYTVTLTVTGPGGTSTLTRGSYITTYAPAVADFSGTPLSGIVPFGVTFTNTSTGDFVSSLWDFGDGVTSTLPSPSHTYAVGGIYTVSLTVSGNGGTNTLTRQSYVTAYTPVQADFTATPTSGPMPLSVIFNNQSTGSYTTASWTFGDGGTSSEINPTYVYSVPGLYPVGLTVNGPGGTSSLTRPSYIEVTKSADLSLVPGIGHVSVGQVFSTVITVAAGQQPVNGVGAYLDFDPAFLQVVDPMGDPTTVISNTNTPMNTELENTVDNVTGKINLSVGKLSGALPSGTFAIGVINFKAITVTNGTTVTFAFNQGANRLTDVTYGAGTSALRATYGGIYTITLVPAPPSSVAVTGPTAGVIGTEYSFNASTSPVTATQPITYEWQATGQTGIPPHTERGLTDSNSYTWSTPGTKVVSVTATNRLGSATGTHSIILYTPPTASFTANPLAGIAPFNVNFQNTSTGDWSSSVWDFGDGGLSTADNPQHNYANPGAYTVTLTVSGNGGTSTITRTSYITAYTPAVAQFTATPLSGIAPFTVTFTNLSTGDFSSSYWRFGDGSESTETNPTHVYTAMGEYDVRLEVSGNGGTDEERKNGYITVFEYRVSLYPPTSLQTSPVTNTEVNHVLTVVNNGNLIDTYDVSVVGATWPVTPSATVVGPLAPGASETVTITVGITVGVAPGSTNEFEVRVTSRANPNVSDGSVLTTILGVEHGVLVTPGLSDLTGRAGTTASHVFTVNNTGNVLDTFSFNKVSGGSGGWNVDVPNSIQLAAGASAQVTVTVTIPNSGPLNGFNLAALTVTTSNSHNKPAASQQFSVMTRKLFYSAYVGNVGSNVTQP